MAIKEKIAIGTRVEWNGTTFCVTAFVAGIIELRSEAGQTARIDAATLMSSPELRLVKAAEAPPANASFPDNIPEPLVKAAQDLLSHLQEAITGYRSGSAATALSSEPREQYNPETTNLKQRISAKAKEINVGKRSLWRYKSAYEQYGLTGLIDERKVRGSMPFASIDPRIRENVLAVFATITDGSNISKEQIRRRVERSLKQNYPDEDIKLPSRPNFNRLLDELAGGKGIFGSAKGRRSIDNRPAAPYRRYHPSRPGEIILIDSTPLDAYALDPLNFEWIQVQLTLAIDLYTRSIVAWRFTPVSTLAVDAALLLFDIIRPKLMRPGWPSSAKWPYVGVPENIVIEIAGEDAQTYGVAGIPFMHPETVVVDRGRVFISQAFKDACSRLGINLQLARPYTPTDKAQVERTFRTIRERFVENLPGYKGPDLFSRGADVENEAYFFLDEIEALFSEWVATYWQQRQHDGLYLPHTPLLKLSPNEMYDEGLSRAGFVYIVPDQSLYYDLLPTEWRTIQHYGVEINGLVYDGDILNDFRHETSPYKGLHSGKWPIRYDPRDLSQVYFYDHTLNQWHVLSWTGANDPNRPFNDATLGYIKALVKQKGGNPKNRDEVEQALNLFLNRIDDSVAIGRKERKLAAKRAIQASLAAKDRPTPLTPANSSLPAPDAEATLEAWQGPLTGQSGLPLHGDRSSEGQPPTIQVLRTVDEAMDEDDIGF